MKRLVTGAFITAVSIGSAYAAQETGERDFPVAIIFSLIAVFMGAGVAIFAANQKKKNDGEQP